jgi:hypothetical protein
MPPSGKIPLLAGNVEDKRAVPMGFFAYPANPPIVRATISAAIEALNKTNNVLLVSWETLEINGKYIISEILGAIDDCDFFCADVTGINPNVMFELGYAIATNKRVWIVRDESYADAKKEFEQLRLLTTVGYTSYTNSIQIIDGFFKECPYLNLGETIFQTSIAPNLAPQSEIPKILYLKSKHDTEASVRVTRAIEDSGVTVTLNDPNEISVQPLYWYAQELYDAVGLITHFLSPAREGFKLHNARYALISGLAAGLHVNTLMLAEHSDMLAPLDYRDAVKFYNVPKEAMELTHDWLQPIMRVDKEQGDIRQIQANAMRLATELKDFHLQLGDYVAENEGRRLNDYFVETTVSTDIANGTQTVFVGRKGTGKTANLIHAESILGTDGMNLVCLIKPVGYEIGGLVRLFTHYSVQDQKGYAIESLWKYMLYTELASATVKQINENAIWQMTEPDVRDLVNLIEDESNAFSGDFTVRLERIIHKMGMISDSPSDQNFRKGISEAIHSSSLSRLRVALGKVLSKKKKVLLLVDNLDKPWTKTANFSQLAEFLRGLLSAVERVGDELCRGDKGRDQVSFNSAVFMRSDIFERVIDVTNEPDKLSYRRLRWDDPEMLLRVIEERYVASHGEHSDPAVMWRRYFCPTVRGIPTRQYLTQRILQRPRDIVYLVKAAVSFAVNRKRDRVEEKDILDAEKEYSQYALDSILVENGTVIAQLENLLFEFAGSSAILTGDDLAEIASRVSIQKDKVPEVIEHLIRLSFLGVEIDEGIFAYSEEARERKKNTVISDRFYKESDRSRRYEVSQPFRAYLEVRD